MSSKLQHLQFAKLHLSTHVMSNKVDDSQPVSLGHQGLKTFAIYPSDRARVSRKCVTISLFSLLFLFLFSFSFLSLLERLIGLLFRGPDLLKVVRSTRLDFCRA